MENRHAVTAVSRITRRFVCLLFSLICASQASAQVSALQGCPTAADLKDGIVFETPAKRLSLIKRYRQLEGPYVGTNYVNGIFPDGMTVLYAGLFTYKYWDENTGDIVQSEEPQTDLSQLLLFEPGTRHAFESIRYNPRRPERKWRIEAEYLIEDAGQFEIGACAYAAVRITREGTLTLPDGSVKPDRESFVFIPELLLPVSGSGFRYGDVLAVRKKTLLDGWTWPFSTDAGEILKP